MENKTTKTRISALVVALVMLLSLIPISVLAAERITINADETAFISALKVNEQDKLASLSQADDNTYDLGEYTPGTGFYFQLYGPTTGGKRYHHFDIEVRQGSKEGTKVAEATIGSDDTDTPTSFSGITCTAGDANNDGNDNYDVTFSINSDVLTSESEYYLVILSTTNVPNKQVIGKDIYFRFTVAGGEEPEVPAFTLSQSTVTIEKGNNTGWITFNGYQADVHGTLTVTSENTDIATVLYQPNPRFRITGVGVGTTRVVVSSEDGKTTATCDVTVTAPGAKYMAMSKTSLLLNSGETDTLSAIVLPKDAADKTVTWSSSDESAATVDENGLVTSVNGGTATITATSTTNSGVKATCVVNPVEESIDNLQDKLRVEGNNEVLRLYFTSPSAPNYTTTHLSNGDYWNVANASQATSYRNGRAETGISPVLGPYRNDIPLTISSDTAEFAKYLYDKVTLYEDKELTKEIATFTETNQANQDTIYLKNKSSLCFCNLSLDKTYYVKFSKDIVIDDVPLGSNIILEFHTRKPMDSLTLDRNELTLEEGGTDKLKATGSGPEDFQNEDNFIIWSSSDESVVTVDKKGNLTAVGEGSATITATAPLSGKTATCSVTVEKPKMKAELISSKGNDLKAGTQTTLQVVNMQNGNPEDYTYKFIVYNTSTDSWYKLKDFGPETEFDWYTGPAGLKNLYVDIKSKTDETDLTRVALTGVNVTDSDLSVKSFTSSKGADLSENTTTTLTAEAEKGAEPYLYKFIVHNNNNDQWYKLQDFGEANTYEWYTAGAASKTLYVDVKDATGKVVRAELPVTVK